MVFQSVLKNYWIFCKNLETPLHDEETVLIKLLGPQFFSSNFMYSVFNDGFI